MNQQLKCICLAQDQHSDMEIQFCTQGLTGTNMTSSTICNSSRVIHYKVSDTGSFEPLIV